MPRNVALLVTIRKFNTQMLPKCTRTCLWPSHNWIWRSRSNFVFFGSNHEWKGGKWGGRNRHSSRGSMVSGVSYTETGTGKCSFQGCILTGNSGLWSCWDDASLCLAEPSCSGTLAGLAGLIVTTAWQKVCWQASTGSNGASLSGAMLSWASLVPRATAKHLGKAASCHLCSIPTDCLSQSELFWGLCIGPLRADSTLAFCHGAVQMRQLK